MPPYTHILNIFSKFPSDLPALKYSKLHARFIIGPTVNFSRRATRLSYRIVLHFGDCFNKLSENMKYKNLDIEHNTQYSLDIEHNTQYSWKSNAIVISDRPPFWRLL